MRFACASVVKAGWHVDLPIYLSCRPSVGQCFRLGRWWQTGAMGRRYHSVWDDIVKRCSSAFGTIVHHHGRLVFRGRRVRSDRLDRPSLYRRPILADVGSDVSTRCSADGDRHAGTFDTTVFLWLGPAAFRATASADRRRGYCPISTTLPPSCRSNVSKHPHER